MSRRGVPLSVIPESDCAIVLVRRSRVAVLTGPPADSVVTVPIAPILHALGNGPAAWIGAVIVLGPGSATYDLSFSPCSGAAGVRANDEFAVAAAVAARLGGRILAEPEILVASLPKSGLLRLVPPPRWWHGTWLVGRRDTTVRVAARLLLHGGLVLG